MRCIPAGASTPVFHMDRTEVTAGQFKKFLQESKYSDEHPKSPQFSVRGIHFKSNGEIKQTPDFSTIIVCFFMGSKQVLLPSRTNLIQC